MRLDYRLLRRSSYFVGLVLFLHGIQSWAGGLYLIELSTSETSLAGAGWAARAQDATTVITNPAGMTRLDGTQVLWTVQPLYLNVEFEPDGQASTTGGDADANSWLPGGSLFITHRLTPDISVGFSTAGFFGLGLDYDDDWPGRYYIDEILLQSVGFQPSIGYRVN